MTLTVSLRVIVTLTLTAYLHAGIIVHNYMHGTFIDMLLKIRFLEVGMAFKLPTLRNLPCQILAICHHSIFRGLKMKIRFRKVTVLCIQSN